MRNTCLNQVHELARKDPRILFLGSDLGAGTLQAFREELPEQFLMEGISEQALVGMAAGLALEGRVVYLNTIATFLTRRCYEQLALDLCLHKAKVRLIGSGGGLVYAPLGPTHQATEDIAILRPLPGMGILAPADATEMKRLMPTTVDYDGPLYIRLGKGGDPVVTPDEPFVLGAPVVLRSGRNILLITTGTAASLALKTADLLAASAHGLTETLVLSGSQSLEMLQNGFERCYQPLMGSCETRRVALRSLQKWHGAGNDFIVDVIEQGTANWWTPQRAKDICNRQTGIGADGLLLAEVGSEVSMVLYNADGSIAEMSGNGIRCLAAAVHRATHATWNELKVSTQAGVKTVTLNMSGDRGSGSVDMGLS